MDSIQTSVPDPEHTENNSQICARALPDQSRVGVGYLVRHTHKAFARVLAEKLAPFGVSPGQWTVLRALWQLDCPSQVELAARIRVEKASLTSVLISLERQGLITRRRSEVDRRRWHVHLTQRGRELEGQLLPFAREIDGIATRGLTKQDAVALKQLLLRVLGNLQQ